MQRRTARAPLRFYSSGGSIKIKVLLQGVAKVYSTFLPWQGDPVGDEGRRIHHYSNRPHKVEMKWVPWPNAPIIGGWAVLFTPRKYIFVMIFAQEVLAARLSPARPALPEPAPTRPPIIVPSSRRGKLVLTNLGLTNLPQRNLRQTNLLLEKLLSKNLLVIVRTVPVESVAPWTKKS